jgi:polysaccharide deacetylase family protein (PEP-CTERM system associated)
VLEQVSGQAVRGYRAPSFSIMRETAWAIDELVQAGYQYDSSVYPVRHDRYGVPAAPRRPFRIQGEREVIWELPPATWRVLGQNIPVGGGGYFRLFPRALLRRALAQIQELGAVMLYFHPWEFDPRQERLPLPHLRRYRTYVGLYRSAARLDGLIRSLQTGACLLPAAEYASQLNRSQLGPSPFALNLSDSVQRKAEKCGPQLG